MRLGKLLDLINSPLPEFAAHRRRNGDEVVANMADAVLRNATQEAKLLERAAMEAEEIAENE